MTETEVRDGMAEIFRDVFDDDALVLDDALSADTVASWDSLKTVAIYVAVEARFGIRLRSREVDTLHCVGDLIALVERKTAA